MRSATRAGSLRALVLAATFTLCGFASTDAAANALLDRIAQPLPDVPRNIQSLQRKMAQQYESEQFDAALRSCEEIVSALPGGTPASDRGAVQPWLNLGMLRWINGDGAGAVEAIEHAVTLIEQEDGVYAAALIEPLQTLGQLRFAAADLDGAEELFHRAQHVLHRVSGVYSLEQTNLIRWISRVAERKGDREAATQQRAFLLKINEAQFGEDEPGLLPALDDYATYLESVDAYRDALLVNARAVDIIEESYGKDDLRLSRPLEQITLIGIHDKAFRGSAHRAAERRVELLLGSPEADAQEQVMSLTALGDLAVVSGDDPAEAYRKAWATTADREEFRPLLEDAFGTPLRLAPKPRIFPVERFHRQPGDDGELYAEYEFTVTAEGRTANVELIGTNVPLNRIRELRQYIFHDFRYRPRMVNGEPVATEKIRLRQQFVMEELPTQELKLSEQLPNRLEKP